MSQELLKKLAQEAVAGMPSARWIAQDQCSGDWWAFKEKPYFSQKRKMWLVESPALSFFIGQSEIMPNNQVYEIAKIIIN